METSHEKEKGSVKTTLYLLLVFAALLIGSWLVVLIKLLSGGSVSG